MPLNPFQPFKIIKKKTIKKVIIYLYHQSKR